MRWKKRARAGLLVVLLACLQGFLFIAVSVHAASGMVYSCTVNQCYAHPVTGVIEDSGGEASYTTGQGMAEGAIYSFGIMEVTDTGEYYLTFRISLVDYTSDHSFFVQNVGDSEWSEVTPTVTDNGVDSNGTTSDLCIQVPSENCIVRISMYVIPMERNVVFYFYPNNYTEGNSTEMTAAIITEYAGSGTETAQADNSKKTSEIVDETTSIPASEITKAESTNQMVSSIETAATPVMNNTSDVALNSTQGLSLSTAVKAEKVETEIKSSNGISMGNLIMEVTIAITISGLILMAAAAVIVYYFRKNWRRWGGYDDEKYSDEDD